MKRRWSPALLWALALLPAGFNLWRYAGFVLDDTFISLRYAANFAAGHGLVFNPGERVEGYTNFLLVIVSAACLAVGLDPAMALKGLLVAAGGLTLWLTARLERRVAWRDRAEADVPISVLLLLPLEAFVYWSLCPMETMLFTALLLAALSAAMYEQETHRWRGSALLFVLLALTRPEGALLFALTTVAVVACGLPGTSLAAPLRRAAANTAVFTLGFGAYFLWRYRYYGSLLPNTYYAKVTGGESQLLAGLKYFGEWLLGFPLLGLGLFGGAVLLWRMRQSDAWPSIATLIAVTAGYSAYVVAIGGDFMPFFRFFIPVLPLYCVLLAWSLRCLLLPRLRPAAATWSVAAVLVLHTAVSFITEQPYRAFVAHRTAVVGRAVGEWLAQQFAPDDLIALNTAGAVPYFSKLPAIDMLGLTDAQIARREVYIVSTGWAGHRRGWGEYVLARRPRVILWYNSAGSREPFYLSDHELADHPFFRFFYLARTASLPPLGDPARSLARFWGFPFGYDPSGTATSADLGLRAVLHERPVPSTEFHEGPIGVNFFERDRRDEGLWPLAAEHRGRLDAFIDAAAERWRTALAGQPPPDPRAVAAVEALCRDAYAKVEAGDHAAARLLLTEAMRRNGAARSPLAYQYAANLATLTGELFVAIAAQKEALRLDPDNALYRHNLRSLLTVPYAEATKKRAADERR